MNECPHCAKRRTDLPPLPERISRLPVGKNGYPIPYFVAEVNGSREDFRIADPDKVKKCIMREKCWVCGEPTGVHLAFVIGPMCIINRLSADPFMHVECAEWSVKACPFLLRPNMVRREDELTQEAEQNVSGLMIKRNPGVTAIWICRQYTVEVDNKGYLFRLQGPDTITWWREGRTATRSEILISIDSGLPFLREGCYTPEDHKKLDAQIKEAMRLLPSK